MSRIWPVRARPSSASSGSGTPPEPASESGSLKSSSKTSVSSRDAEHEAAAALEAERIGQGRPVERAWRRPPASRSTTGVPSPSSMWRRPTYQRSPALLVDAAEAEGRDVVVERREPALQLPAHRLGVGLVRGEDVVVRRPWPRSARRMASRHDWANSRRARSNDTSGCGMPPNATERPACNLAIFRAILHSACTIRTLRLRERAQPVEVREATTARRPATGARRAPPRPATRSPTPCSTCSPTATCAPPPGRSPNGPTCRCARCTCTSTTSKICSASPPTALRPHRADAHPGPCDRQPRRRAAGPRAAARPPLRQGGRRRPRHPAARGRSPRRSPASCATRTPGRARDLERVFATELDAHRGRGNASAPSPCSTCSPGPTRGRRCAMRHDAHASKPRCNA